MSRRTDRRTKRARQQWADDLRWLMGAEPGRRIVGNLVDRSGVNTPSMTGNSQTYWLLGRREFMQEIISDIRVADLAGFRRMEDEKIAAADALNLEDGAADDEEDD